MASTETDTETTIDIDATIASLPTLEQDAFDALLQEYGRKRNAPFAKLSMELRSERDRRKREIKDAEAKAKLDAKEQEKAEAKAAKEAEEASKPKRETADHEAIAHALRSVEDGGLGMTRRAVAEQFNLSLGGVQNVAKKFGISTSGNAALTDLTKAEMLAAVEELETRFSRNVTTIAVIVRKMRNEAAEGAQAEAGATV